MSKVKDKEIEILSKHVDILPDGEKKRLLKLLEEKREAERVKQLKYDRNLLSRYAPYAKQKLFHAMGCTFNEVLFIAGNQLGKTLAGAFEMAYHLTGMYPIWWTGRRFSGAIRAICGSESNELTTKGIQRNLVGKPEDEMDWGKGAIPYDCIVSTTKKAGVPYALDSIIVKHVSGGNSVLKFASYDQGPSKWQADTVDLVWLDEEPPHDVYSEAVTRTIARNGYVYMTFTPLKGVSSVVKQFYPKPDNPYRNYVNMGIYDVEHYSAERAQQVLAQYPAHERDARGFGTPMFGDGMVFSMNVDSVIVRPFVMPSHFRKLAAIDFGWNHPTAVVEIHWDEFNDVIYATNCYRAKEKTPPMVYAATKHWLGDTKVAYPHDGLQHDKGSGEQLAVLYKKAGFNMTDVRATDDSGGHGLEATILEMVDRFDTGRLKIFTTCIELIDEIRQYHRVKGQIVKDDDDAISALRYAIMMKRYSSATREETPNWVKEFKMGIKNRFSRSRA